MRLGGAARAIQTSERRIDGENHLTDGRAVSGPDDAVGVDDLRSIGPQSLEHELGPDRRLPTGRRLLTIEDSEGLIRLEAFLHASSLWIDVIGRIGLK